MNLHFFGDLTVDQLPTLQANLAEFFPAYPAMIVHCPHLILLPNLHHPHVLALACENQTPLTKLSKDFRQSLKNWGFEPEHRKYLPHITIARIKSAVPLPLNLPKPHISFRCESFSLFESTLTPKGAVYRILETYPLR